MRQDKISNGHDIGFTQSHREAVIFWTQQLEPMIHLWLSLLQQYQKMIRNDLSSKENEKFLTMIKSMTEIAAKATDALHCHLCPLLQVWIIQHKQQSSVAQKEGILQRMIRDFLSLPARVVLKLNQEDQFSIWSVASKDDDEKNLKSRKRRIQQSYQSKLVHQAVMLLEAIHKGIYSIYAFQKKDLLGAWGKSPGSASRSAAFHQNCTIDFLVGTAMALPSGQEIARTRATVSSSLDVSLRECLTKTVRSLSALANTSNLSVAEASDVSKMITQSLGGALFVRVVDSLTALVLPTSLAGSEITQSSQREQGPMELARSNQRPLSDPVVIGDSLDALHRWMTAVPEAEKWQQVFPGTFKSLFRRMMDTVKSLEGTAGTVIQKALRSLNTLLRIATRDVPSATETRELASPMAVAPLMSLMKIEDGAAGSKQYPKQVGTSLPVVFGKRIREVLPMPLQNLLAVLLAKQRKSSINVKDTVWTEEFVELINFVLTSQCWDDAMEHDETLKSMKATAMDAFVSIAIIHESKGNNLDFYKTVKQLQKSETPDSIRLIDSFSNRFAILLEEISVACLGHQQDELQSKLLLISGYVTYGGRTSQKQIRCLLFENSKVSKLFQETVFQLFGVDFRRWSSSFLLSSYVTNKSNPDSMSISRPEVPPWRFLNEESFYLARKFLKLISVDVLRSKGTCMLVDRFIADFYDSARSRARYTSISGATERISGHEEFLHYWTGALVACRYMVEALPSKAGKSLFALTNSVIPILLTPTMIDFPRAFRTRAASSQSSDTRLILPTSLQKGNCAVKLFLLEFVHQLVAKIATSFPGTKNINAHTLLQECLCPLIEAMVETSCKQLNDTATYCLSSLSLSCGFSSLAESIYCFRGGLFSTLIGRSRNLPRLTSSKALSSVLPQQVEGVAADSSPYSQDVAILPAMSCVVLNHISSFVESSDGSVEFDISQCRSLAMSILPHFDQGPQGLSQQSLLVFASFFKSICWTMTECTRKRGIFVEVHSNASSSWISTLKKFRRGNIMSTVTETTEAIPKKTDTNETLKAFVTKDDTDFVSKLVDRSSHMLAHEDLFVQGAGCQALQSEIAFLSVVARSNVAIDETNGARTALLRHVADIWPVVLSRLRTSWALVNGSSLSSLNTTDIFLPQSSGDRILKSHDTRHYVLIQNLVDLVAVLVVETGDFLASRFRDQIWPIFAQILLSTKVPELQKSGGSEEKVVEAVLSCLSKIYDSAGRFEDVTGSGLALSSLIPDILSKIIPLFPSRNERIFDLCIQVCSNASMVDYDAVSTALSNLSRTESKFESDVTARVEAILISIDNLPEQELW